MSEQRVLFDPPPAWIAMIWDRCGAEVRRECIAILAQMGRASLAPSHTPEKPVTTSRAGEETTSGRRESDER